MMTHHHCHKCLISQFYFGLKCTKILLYYFYTKLLDRYHNNHCGWHRLLSSKPLFSQNRSFVLNLVFSPSLGTSLIRLYWRFHSFSLNYWGSLMLIWNTIPHSLTAFAHQKSPHVIPVSVTLARLETRFYEDCKKIWRSGKICRNRNILRSTEKHAHIFKFERCP